MAVSTGAQETRAGIATSAHFQAATQTLPGNVGW